ncbi:MAG: serine hydrolase domain-containing protein, partial [Candidatus Hydrogenedentes bacterium]|nr:serine hydrolase domain-containing protein [Candidatus Hydrogenedentota bacterium]
MQDLTEILPTATNIIQVGMDRGLHIGAQLYVSLKGECIAECALGLADAEANEGEGIALTTDHLVLSLSAGKPVGAVAIGQLWEQGQVDLDAPIAETIPEFGAHGKDSVTMRHILTHTGGFRDAG